MLPRAIYCRSLTSSAAVRAVDPSGCATAWDTYPLIGFDTQERS